MFTTIMTVNKQEYLSHLLLPITKEYRFLIKGLKNYYSIDEVLTIINISETTHLRYMKDDTKVSPSIKLHLDLLLKINKE